MSDGDEGDKKLGEKFRLLDLEHRADDAEDALREMADLLQAWKSGKLLVKFILLAGALIVTLGAAWTAVKGLAGVAGNTPP